MSPAEEMEYLDGPSLMEWVRETVPNLFERPDGNQISNVRNVLGDSWTRRFYDWDKGARPSVYTVDRLCVKLDLNILDIPDHIWREDHAPRMSAERKWLRTRAFELLDAGYLPGEAERELGLTRGTVRGWKASAKRQARREATAPIPERLEAAAKAAA